MSFHLPLVTSKAKKEAMKDFSELVPFLLFNTTLCPQSSLFKQAS